MFSTIASAAAYSFAIGTSESSVLQALRPPALTRKLDKIIYKALGSSYYERKYLNSKSFAYTGPFLGFLAKTTPSQKAVLFNK